MIDAAHLLTFLWLAGWALLAFLELAHGRSNAIFFPILAHFLFCGIPALLDVVVGTPTYRSQPGFAIATRDQSTVLVYCAYVSAVPVFWWTFGRSCKSVKRLSDAAMELRTWSGSSWIQPLLVILAVSPLCAFAFAPDPGAYETYFQSQRSWNSVLAEDYHHSFVTISVKICILAVVTHMFLRPRLTLGYLLLVTPLCLFALWLDGKRNSVAIWMVLMVFISWARGNLPGLRLLAAGLTLSVMLGAYSHGYQVFSGRVSGNSGDGFYENFRIDYGRDDVIKLTIFSELNPDVSQVLEYRGQSLLFYATMWVPRDVWLDKPYPYAQYLTSAMLCAPPRLWGWAMTTSCLEEAIANLGWLGMLVGPLVPLAICRATDSSQSPVAVLTGPLVVTLLLAVQAVAIAALIAIWACSLMLSSLKERLRQGNHNHFPIMHAMHPTTSDLWRSRCGPSHPSSKNIKGRLDGRSRLRSS